MYPITIDLSWMISSWADKRLLMKVLFPGRVCWKVEKKMRGPMLVRVYSPAYVQSAATLTSCLDKKSCLTQLPSLESSTLRRKCLTASERLIQQLVTVISASNTPHITKRIGVLLRVCLPTEHRLHSDGLQLRDRATRLSLWNQNFSFRGKQLGFVNLYTF